MVRRLKKWSCWISGLNDKQGWKFNWNDEKVSHDQQEQSMTKIWTSRGLFVNQSQGAPASGNNCFNSFWDKVLKYRWLLIVSWKDKSTNIWVLDKIETDRTIRICPWEKRKWWAAFDTLCGEAVELKIKFSDESCRRMPYRRVSLPMIMDWWCVIQDIWQRKMVYSSATVVNWHRNQ